MGGWQLREASAADAETLATLLRDAFEEYRGQLDPPSGAHEETAAGVRERLAYARAVLALIDEAPAGCVFYELPEEYAYLSRLAVLPAYRRRGLARGLIDYVEGRAREVGRTHIRLGVRIVLHRQRAYYERLGYRAIHALTHAGYAEPTYLMMEKRLAAPA
jgi:ribosomal protein S18 acetylase RimI-like enzyme